MGYGWYTLVQSALGMRGIHVLSTERSTLCPSILDGAIGRVAPLFQQLNGRILLPELEHNVLKDDHAWKEVARQGKCTLKNSGIVSLSVNGKHVHIARDELVSLQ
eukprot:CAMPEP_0183339874 /NCGR_PEP_ID=MMETSP0164_2-20130417/6637_1 /TAXON_ID=221442 /ORGANISM="Coccolithus pelagicus ssp braarudi, Strain PLY182g" /LENGTH=104 /DNA_ID=CAMNT_0025509939 /DNA_START=248 /DNA_END=562 /DNA_ORIENTATION=+